jgi:glutamine synthetase adenylyltransferase
MRKALTAETAHQTHKLARHTQNQKRLTIKTKAKKANPTTKPKQRKINWHIEHLHADRDSDPLLKRE